MKLRGLRWWIVALVFLAAALNYVDRQALSALAPTIQADLGIDDRGYANVVNFFLLAYTISYLISGKLVDRLGTRAGTVLFVIWWSLANILTAASQGMRSLGFSRFLLGLGEAGIWPAASKMVAERFRPGERALAIAFYTTGSTVGATLAPFLVIPLAALDYSRLLPPLADLWGSGTGWRMAFVLTGLAGIAWVLPWLLLCRDSRAGGDRARPPEPGWSWRRVFACRPLWLLLAARLITDPAWYFYQFWFVKYLGAERGLDQGALSLAWVLFAAAGAGSLAGGWLSGLLVKRGFPPVAARLRVMLGCACVMPLAAFVTRVPDLALAMVLASCTAAAALAWLINLGALVVDLVPGHSVGTAFSVVATGSTLGGMGMNLLVAAMVSGPPGAEAGFLDRACHGLLGPLAALVEGRGYGTWFLIMAFLHPFALLLIRWGGLSRGEARA